MNEPEHVKNILDAGALVALITTIFGWLPKIAVLLTVIWYVIRIIESDTYKRLMKKVGRGSSETQ